MENEPFIDVLAIKMVIFQFAMLVYQKILKIRGGDPPRIHCSQRCPTHQRENLGRRKATHLLFSDVEIQQFNMFNFPGIESVSIVQHKLLLHSGALCINVKQR
jgi:hypothetical protein